MTADQDDHRTLTDALPPLPVQTNDMASVARQILDFITKNPQIFGGADIFNLNFREPHSRSGMLAGVLVGLVDGDYRPAIRKFVIVVPPDTDLDRHKSIAWSEFVATFRLLAGREMRPREHDWYSTRFRVVAARDRRSQTVLTLLKAQTERTAVIVTEAASYRDDKIAPYVAQGSTAPLHTEDVWAPQLHALAASAVEHARKGMLYVALDSNHLSPHREVLSNLLLSIDGCGVMGWTSEDDPNSSIAERLDQWDAWIRAGLLGRTLSDIDQLPAKCDESKPYLRIQVLHRAGQFPQALQSIREITALGCQMDASLRVKLARIAQATNASNLAAEILAPAVNELDSREDLESALATAHNLGSTQLELAVAERLGNLYPGSPGLRLRRQRALLASRDYAKAADIFAEETDGQANSDFYGTLSEFFSGSEVPEYRALIASARGDISQADAYRMACVEDALARNLVHRAFQLVIPIPSTPAQKEHGESLLLQVLEEILLLARKGGVLLVPSDEVQAAVLSLIERLAANPNNHALRFALVRLVQPSVAGTMGMALMASVVLNLFSRPIRIQKQPTSSQVGVDWIQNHKVFVETVFEWLASEAPVVIGTAILPEHLLTEPADEVVSAITDYLVCAPIDSEDDINASLRWLTVATLVTPHSSDPDLDLELIRLVACKLADSGNAQLARDLSQQALLNSTPTPRRRRLGWFTMADVYHRCHNHLEGLLAIACTLSADDVVDEEQIWQEIIAIARYLRDCGLHEQFRSVIEMAREILQRTSLSEALSHRLHTLELQVRQFNLRDIESQLSFAQLEELLGDVVRNAMAVLEYGDMTEPVAAILGQLLRKAKEVGATIPPEADRVFEDLCKYAMGSPSSRIRAMSVTALSAEELLAFLETSSPARYSDDIGYDIHNAVILARRTLASDECICDAVDTSFVLELLSDRGVAAPGWDEAAEPPRLSQRVHDPAEIARSISRAGLNVVQAGFDAFGRVVRVSAVNGRLETPVREPLEVIHGERFKSWAVEYPYAYGVDETTTNLFYTTTADLRLSSLPEGPVVVVADTGLQAFPPNLLYVEEEFAGRTRPMAAAPSLAWLRAAHAKGLTGDGRICAWIPTEVGGTEAQIRTLPMIAQRMETTFDQYNIIADNGSTIPATFAGATIAVVTAHGRIHPDGRYFHVISNEGSLRATASDLANALRNVCIVILFVCSGGRTDKHPRANTTLGLSRQVLDRGCSCVIAPPWPLDARVPSYWLPVFLSHWYQGKRLIDATFSANRLVDRDFAQDPARGLAMNIFGNPWLRRT